MSVIVNSRPKVIIVSAVKTGQHKLVDHLDASGLEASVVTFGQEMIVALNTDHFDLVIVDLSNKVMDKLEQSRQLHALAPYQRHVPILSLTNEHSLPAETLLKVGILGGIQVPFSLFEISDAISQAAPMLAKYFEEHLEQTKQSQEKDS